MSLSASELASMRATLNSSLPDSGTVWRKGTATTSYGYDSSGTVAVGTAACRVAPLTGSPFEQDIAGRSGTNTLWLLTFPQGTDVTRADQVRTGGRTFEVQGVVVRSNEISLRVTAAEEL